MGFPLSTDIFGQLKWLVKQVKLLVFRVTRLEQGGGGGAQDIDQVLRTGSTATNRSLLMNDTLGVFPSSIGIGSTFGSQSGDLAGIKLQGPNGNFSNTTNTSYFNKLSINFTEINDIDGSGLTGFYGRSQFGIAYTTSNDSFYAGINNGYGGQLGWTLANNAGNQIQANGSILGFILNNVETMLIGNTSGYNGRPGLTLNNDTPNSIYDILNIDSTTIAINNTDTGAFSYTKATGFTAGFGGNISTVLDAQGIVISDNAATQAYNLSTTIKSDYILVELVGTAGSTRLNFLPNDGIISTNINGNDVGLLLNNNNRKYTIGEEGTGNPFFGIEPGNARLLSSGLLQSGAHNTPAGFIEILIDGSPYWIELWT